jgi:hypothetical protein
MLNAQDWHALSKSAAAEYFQFFFSGVSAPEAFESCCANEARTVLLIQQ